MIRVAIIVTSPLRKVDRFIPGDEWFNAWRFEDSELAYRLSNQPKVNFCNINCIPILQKEESIIIWINTKKIEIKNLRNFLSQLLTHLTGNNVNQNEIWVAYHDVIKDYIPRVLHLQAKLYSLAPGNRSQFQAIIKKDNSGNEYLEAKSDFEQIIECFFFNWPKLIALLKHRIAHILGPADMDLQRLQEKAKAKDYINFCKELKDFRERYKEFDLERAFEVIESEVDGFLKSQEKEFKNFRNLENLFKQNKKIIIEFLNRVKREEVGKIFEEIEKKDINPLSFWLRELDKNLDETIEGG